MFACVYVFFNGTSSIQEMTLGLILPIGAHCCKVNLSLK